MNKPLAIAVTIAAALLLAGCAAPAAEQTPSTPTSAASAAEPLTAETPTTPAVSEADVAFLAAVREAQSEFATQIPDATDAQLLELGAEACDVLSAGTDTTALSLIEGETPNAIGNYSDTDAIVTAASIHLCR